ncbi:protein translocase subunit SecD [Chlamydiifrater phoenicopteri]|uniref:protein translocase subunit SecD n=1 Tax=Chlamydiifrater phoenicopteri TaxID=2681469 RepID=UPI001BD0BFBE|nr:protein translocase subunit SecD [Chlamydiifrater phoenicopteri]
MTGYKRNHWYFIIFVFSFALYNVLPTCFYHARPVGQEFGSKESRRLVREIVRKVDKTYKDSFVRIRGITKDIQVHPKEIRRDDQIPGVVNVTFESKKDADLFVDKISLSEKSVPFVSQRLHVVGIQEESGSFLVQVASSVVGQVSSQDFRFVTRNPDSSEYRRGFLNTANDIAAKVFQENEFASCCGYLSPLASSSAKEYSLVLARTLLEQLNYLPEALAPRLITFTLKENKELESFVRQLDKIVKDATASKEDRDVCSEVLQRIRRDQIFFHKKPTNITSRYYDCRHKHPLFSSVEVLYSEGKILLNVDKEVLEILNSQSSNNDDLNKKTFINRLLQKEKERVADITGLSVSEGDKGFIVSLFSSPKVKGHIIFDGSSVLEMSKQQVLGLISVNWRPKSSDFSRSVFPVSDKEPSERDQFGCYVFFPKESCKHFRKGRVYVVLKGINAFIEKYRQVENEQEKQNFDNDIRSLLKCFYHQGVFVKSIGEDRIFEIREPFALIFDSSEESFSTHEEKGCLDLTNVQDYLAGKNRRETSRQKELLLWKERYQRAKNSGDLQEIFCTTAPHRNVFYENCKLNVRKYWRGEKALRWGVDLAGGKHVTLAFKDRQGNIISDKDEITRIYDELYARLNKLGVSEIEMRREGSNIHVSVPGCSTLSAKELLGFSSMTFHVVNEKFASSGSCGVKANTFLDYLRYRSLSEGKRSSKEITELAEKIFSGEIAVPKALEPVIEELKASGLNFSNGLGQESGNVDEQLSAIVVAKDVDEGVNPLIIVFKTPALEGSALSNISTDFSSSDGYSLNFFVKKSLSRANGSVCNPSDLFHKWTSTFCREAIQGTQKAADSHGRGWRMAVVINGEGISFPALNAPLKDSARVTGNFSYGEINRLANDLKAGTLSCFPEILSEETVAPELGKSQRVQGLISAVVGVAVLMALMCVYYRFGGIIASAAVLLNLILIWAALQYMDASITLSGLAGIVLAMGMAVDANVLVFERVKEEYAKSSNLLGSLEMGYKKAFGAIFDSNLTTVLAAVLLIFMDTGPIRGFALTLILGILSSMFTSLFMTKFFFSIWIEKTGSKELNMMSRFSQIKHNFLLSSRKAWLTSVLILFGGGATLFFGVTQSLPGIDFKGGYSFTLDPSESNIKVAQTKSFGQEVGRRLVDVGVSPADFRIKTFGESKKVRVYLSSRSLEKIKKVQNQSPMDAAGALLEKAEIAEKGLNVIKKEWTQVSGQFSAHMCEQAVVGLLLALVVILLYITIRFEWKYAVSAVFALVHDLFATCSVLAIAHFFLKKVQLDLQAVGALMTVLGYSLNNTLIVFDRIREDCKTRSADSLKDIVENALRGTFSRTVMTTSTTLSVLLVLLFIGGGAIFNFAFIMTVGIILGTLSSLYIAPPLLLFMMQERDRVSSF